VGSRARAYAPAYLDTLAREARESESNQIDSQTQKQTQKAAKADSGTLANSDPDHELQAQNLIVTLNRSLLETVDSAGISVSISVCDSDSECL
jgi:hypothetical protein